VKDYGFGRTLSGRSLTCRHVRRKRFAARDDAMRRSRPAERNAGSFSERSGESLDRD
jgi:hypothetical protein